MSKPIKKHNMHNLLKYANLSIGIVLFFTLSANAQQTSSSIINSDYNRGGTTDWMNEFSKHVLLQKYQFSSDSLMVYNEFKINSDNGLHETWGRGKEIAGVYFDEKLPLFFSRKLYLDEFILEEGRLEWIFTGKDGGFTVAVSKDTIWLYQRFYDSFGLNEINGNILHYNRHPEKIWVASATAYKGNVKTIELSINYKMVLNLRVNGQTIARQLLILDVTAHQLRCTSENPRISGKLFIYKPLKCSITESPDKQYQEILGFGGIAIPTAYEELSNRGKEMWWKIIKEYNLLLHREYPISQKLNPEMDNWDIINDATIHYYGDNFPNSEISDFEYIKKVQKLGGINIFEFWKFPSWIQKSKDDIDINEYVRTIISYCNTAREKTGEPPYIVGIQNEVTQEKEAWQLMVIALRNGLDNAGFKNVKIHMHNASNIDSGINAAKAFTERQDVWAKIDYSASNMYDYQNYFMNPDGYDKKLFEFHEITKDKPFISPELSINSSIYQMSSYRLAYQMGQLYYKNLTITNAVALMYCWSLLNTVQPSYSASRSLFGVDELIGSVPSSFGFQDRVFGAFSRRVMRGMKRIDVWSSMKDILTISFINEKENLRTVILLNRATIPVRINIDNGEQLKWKETTSQYHRNFISDNKEPIIINPGEIITLTNVSLNK